MTNREMIEPSGLIKGLTPKEYARQYQQTLRKDKEMVYFGCLLTKEEKDKIKQVIRDRQITAKQFILEKII